MVFISGMERNMLLSKLLVSLSLMALTASAQPSAIAWNAPGAANPFIPGYFADPTIRKFGDTYYLYATTDGTGNGYGPAQVWVSNDFRNWKNVVMNWPVTEVVWAPDVVQQPDGTFRYYYCEPCHILVGEGPTPVGPWHNILDKPDAVLVPDRYVHNAITLDPQLFRDDDGSEYLYFITWGIYDGFGCGVAKLREKGTVKSEKFAAAVGDARYWREDNPFPIAADEFFSEKRLIPNTELKDIFEAPFVFKRNGIYYFTYSSGSCHDHTYRVQYATSKTGPMGPYEYKGCILQTNADSTVHGPGHHSVFETDGRYYIVYHRHNIPRSVHGFNRQVCIDEMRFDTDGNILPVLPTHNAQNIPFVQADSHYKNLAYGAKVSASSYYDDWFRPEYAVDDNNATLWKARHTSWDPVPHSEWIQIDLGRKMQFREIWTQFEYPTFFYQYKIETSDDGHLWKIYADRTDNTMPGSPMIDRCVVKARYIRITISDTQKNGHLPAIWNVKVWQKAPPLPEISVQPALYPGMHRKDVAEGDRRQAMQSSLILDANELGHELSAPMDIEEVILPGGITMKANKPVRLRVKDGRWALFFNGSQMLTATSPLSSLYGYNAPYTISAWALQTQPGSMSTVVSLGSSHADLATTALRLGTHPETGLVSHNGSFESSGHPDAVHQSVGAWHHWVVTYDGWMERIYLDGQLLRQQNNFLTVRPEGAVVIGADGSGTNTFRGYLSKVSILPRSVDADAVRRIYRQEKDRQHPSLGDDDFDESDPDSRFTLSPDMMPVTEKREPFTLSATTLGFNGDSLNHGGHIYREVTGDFVVMCRILDMEGLGSHRVKSYNEGGLLVADGRGTYYQLGLFPLYNCGNMLTVLSAQGRPQYPNYKGYEADRLLQFERRGNLLFARTSGDGKSWSNMPGSPVEVNSPTLGIGAYQTTYSDNISWISICDYIIYQH